MLLHCRVTQYSHNSIWPWVDLYTWVERDDVDEMTELDLKSTTLWSDAQLYHCLASTKINKEFKQFQQSLIAFFSGGGGGGWCEVSDWLYDEHFILRHKFTAILFWPFDDIQVSPVLVLFLHHRGKKKKKKRD